MALHRPAATVASAEGLVAFWKRDDRLDETGKDLGTGANVVAPARDPRDLDDLTAQPGWRRLDPDPRRAPWTDDYANVLSAILDRKLGR
jgi:hypothetical protein